MHINTSICTHAGRTYIWNIVVSSLTFFFLQFNTYTANRSLLNPLHQSCHIPVQCALFRKLFPNQFYTQYSVPCNLVTEPFTGDDGNIFAHSLICVKVHSEASVVLLDDDLRRLLNSLRAYSPLHKKDTVNKDQR